MNRITKTMTLVAISLLGLFGCNSKTSNDLLVYDFRGKYGYVDRKGNVVIEPQFDNAKSFSEGLAWAEKVGKTGYIDHSGAYVIELDENPLCLTGSLYSRSLFSRTTLLSSSLDKSSIFF